MLRLCEERIADRVLAASTALDSSEPDALDFERGLIQRLGKGDQDAMGPIYDRYAATVHALGLKMLRDPQGAEDVVQETFWRVWKTAGRYRRDRGAPGAWIYGIGRNVAIDLLRRKSVRPPSAADEDEPLMPPPDSGGDTTAAAALETLRRERVREAMDGLSEVQREVIELAYFGGMTRREIAERTGAPLGTVHTRARLALQALSNSLAGETPSSGGDR